MGNKSKSQNNNSAIKEKNYMDNKVDNSNKTQSELLRLREKSNIVEKTKSLDRISIPDELMQQIINKKKIELLEVLFNKLISKMDEMLNLEELSWVKIVNLPFYYVTKENLLVTDIARMKVSSSELSEIEG